MKLELGKTYRTRDGMTARVVCVDVKNAHTCIALVEIGSLELCDFFTSEGRSRTGRHQDIVSEASPYDDYRLDEPVMVRRSSTGWYKRHFAGVEGGWPTAWTNGQTSFTKLEGTCNRDTWHECRRPTPEELKGESSCGKAS
jgi:hypothetical protein